MNDTFFQHDAPDDVTAMDRKHISSSREKLAQLGSQSEGSIAPVSVALAAEEIGM